MRTVSKELAIRLKKAGFPQDSDLKYCEGHTYYDEDEENGKFEACPYDGVLDEDEYCPSAELTCEFLIAAPTTDEVIDRLPHLISLPIGMSRGDFRLHIAKTENHYWVEYKPEGFTTDKIAPIRQADTLVNGLAQMYLAIKEEKWLKEVGS